MVENFLFNLGASLWSDQLHSNVIHTGVNALGGLAISLCCVALVATIVSGYPALRGFFEIVGVLTKISPAVAYVPLLIFLIGVGTDVKILTATLICFYPLLIPTLKAFEKFPDRLNKVADIYDAPHFLRVQVFGYAWLLSGVAEGLITAAPLAVVGSIVADYVAGGTRPGGLGQWIQSASANSNHMQIISGVLGATFLGTIAYAISDLFSRFVRGWFKLTQEG